MGLTDTLRQRCAACETTVTVDCGALGVLSARALPSRECVDDDRAVLYSACQQLQESGEQLRREGRVFQPDEIMQFLSDAEARAGADAVRRISRVQTAASDGGNALDKIRPGSVQAGQVGHGQIRRDSVQGFEETVPEIRRDSVQPADDDRDPAFPASQPWDFPTKDGGQVSHEFFRPNSEHPDKSKKVDDLDKKTQSIVDLDKNAAQDMDADFLPDSRLPALSTAADSDPLTPAEGKLLREIFGLSGRSLHESKSDFGETVHETESEFDGFGRERMHENKSEFPETVHEIKSEFHQNSREAVHEITSESAELLARALLDGLKTAAAVR